MSSPLQDLSRTFGQSAWLDNVRRSDFSNGVLATMRDDGVRGLTSNPSIFQAAIQGSQDYDEQFAAEQARGSNAEQAYWAAVQSDIQSACDIFMPTFFDTNATDGYVSVEVDPRLSNQTPETVAQALELHALINRPNVMIKVPATAAGLPAVTELVAAGISVNVTLIFGLKRYAEVINAYLSGLRLADEGGKDLSQIASVASFFISRVDTEVDRRLAATGSSQAQALMGETAIAQAKLAYAHFNSAFSGTRWAELRSKGAQVQRPLWASTSVKNDAYPDTRYVDELIGDLTVNTLPQVTLDAFVDHGSRGNSLKANIGEAKSTLAELEDVGIDLDDVAVDLERTGIEAFETSFESVLATVATKLRDLVD